MWYKLTLSQQTPVHIGKGTWGVLNETEIFIPGWTVAGALTHLYLLKHLKNGSDINAEDVLKKFQTITNFYPVLKRESNVLLPRFNNGRFFLGDYSEDEFRYKYVKADFKTAIEPILRKAKDENLYEFEFIVPEFNWVGFVKLDDEVASFLKETEEIYIGGDIRYGYGRFKVEEIKEIKEEELEKFNIEVDESNSLKIKNIEEPVCFFVEFTDVIKDKKFEGIPHLYTRLDFREGTPVVKEAYFLLLPGSKVNYDGSLSLEFGILRPTS